MRLLLFVLLSFPLLSSAAESLVYYQASGYNNGMKETGRHTSYPAACVEMATLAGMVYESSGSGTLSGSCYGRKNNVRYQTGTWRQITEQCPETVTNLYCTAVPPDPCASKKDQPTTWKKTWPSADAYQTLGEKINNSGCSAAIVTSSCGTNGATGEFACWGTATYDGVTGVDSTGPSSACGANDPNCAAPEPLTSTNQQKCTPNEDGTTTCVTESGSTEFASGECHVGSTGGATGLVCVKPDYVPEAATNKRTDVIKTEATADGGSKTTTTSTSENKHCVAGKCSTTTTTTTTTTTKDGAGKVTGETSTCTGAKCAGPTDETKPEEEGMGEAKFTAKGGCEGSDCDVDAFNPFGTDAVPGYSDSLNAALSGIKRSPIGSAVSNIRWPTGGSCPVYSMQLFNSSISITEHCTVWESVGSALRAVFLAIWAFAAVRVFLSA